jgi:hypothetical protein
MGVNKIPQRRAQLLADIEHTSNEMTRMMVEATNLNLPIWAEVRRMPCELARWHRDLRQIIPP